MRTKRIINIIETHTGGQPTRTVLTGFPYIPGRTMEEKFFYMKENADWLRTLVCQEPRGSDIMSGAIITTPCNPSADIGVIHFESSGWLPMCGHNTIGLCTAIVEEGIIEVKEPYTHISLETPIGIIKVEVEVDGGSAKAVRFRNTPSFAILQDMPIKSDEWGKMFIDISWGGSAVAFIPANFFGQPLCQENAKYFEKVADNLIPEINNQLTLEHPQLPDINSISHLAFFEDGEVMRHGVVGPDGRCDRSPCGNGTCARAALLFAQGKLKIGDQFEQHSLIDSIFTCKCVDIVSLGNAKAIIPEISGKAWITAFATYVVDETDPFGNGFLL